MLGNARGHAQKRWPQDSSSWGQTWGWAFATRSFPAHTLGALAFAGRVLPDATHRGMQCFRSHSGTVAAVSGGDLSSEASSPGSATTCRWRARQTGCRHACDLSIYRVGTVATRAAPAFGRALTARYGSDLLTLRLPWYRSWVIPLYETAPSRRLAGFARPVRSPPSRRPCAPWTDSMQGLLAGSSRRTSRLRAGQHSSNRNPLGYCVSQSVETPGWPDSARMRFLIAPRRAAPIHVDQTVVTPSRGAGDTCLPLRLSPQRRDIAAPAAARLSPVARAYPSRAFIDPFRSLRSRLFCQRTRTENALKCLKEKHFL